MQVIVAAVLMSALAVAAAVAQSAPRWTDPTGSWSIDFESSGWGSGQGLPPPPEGPTILIVPMTPPPENEVRICLAEEAFSPLAANADLNEVRARGSLVDAAKAREMFPRAGLTDIHISHVVVDGEDVAVIEATSGSNRFRARAFVTPASNRAVLSSLMCISVPGMRADADAEVDTILNTLHFPQ
jgi:hypothetical protein